MIVTSGEEPVEAIPVSKPTEDGWTVQTWGTSETLYRKTCRTNFVYSADTNVGRICAPCALDGCSNERRFTAEDFFGKRVVSIFFDYDDSIYCEKHKNIIYIQPVKDTRNGGVK